WRAMSAAEGLEQCGVEATVADARFVKPLDRELIEGLARTHDLVVTLEDNSIVGGFGSAVGEALHAAGIATPLMTLGLPDHWVEHGGIEELFESLGLGVDTIVHKIAERFETRESDVPTITRQVSEQPAHK
ncbi:MAG: transketolase C-terminal domain-containing protein, partial [Candidatus Sumerlaeota bacterium]